MVWNFSYEKSDTQRFEVPRMLFDDPKVLETYVKKRRDQNLQRWWAQYLESIGDFSGAKGFYQASKDYLSVIRLLCYKGLIDEATEIANKTADKAACYHLACFFENSGDVNSAVHFFTKAHTYSSAIRLAKEHNMKEKLANLALMAGGSDLVEAARYYEDLPGQADKAVMLYHKAGMIGRALDLAFRTEQFSALDLIAKDLDERSDPRVLERAAEFFINNQQYEKAVQFLAYAKNYTGAIELCQKKNVPVTEQLAEILTPSKETIPNMIERNELLEKVADCCVQQRNYHFAAKKYTQAGNMLQAMRSLLKSGDTEKIIFFAKKAHNKEIYILAANFLQTLNWKTDGNFMRYIETFYTKAKAYELLASFYEACAQVEIDDYRDYSKANAALAEAQRCIKTALEDESKNVIELSEKLDELNHRIANIKKFIGIRNIYETDPNDAIRQAQALADEKGIEESVRIGDIYAVMIVHNARKSNFKKAYSLICQLQERQPRIDVSR
uniref:Uncharacterized protein n=1 Tax=Parascaris univalens TaxID=6257 RepID=A0A915BTC4_PARUN